MEQVREEQEIEKNPSRGMKLSIALSQVSCSVLLLSPETKQIEVE